MKKSILVTIFISIVMTSSVSGQQTVEGYHYVQPAWANAGDRVSVVENNHVFIREFNSRQPFQRIGDCPDGWLQAWSPDDRLLAVVCNYNQIVIWETATGRLLQVLPVAIDYLGTISWSPDQNRLMTTGIDSPGLFIWNTQSWQAIPADLPTAGLYMIFNPVGDRILIGMPGGFGTVDSTTLETLMIARVDPGLYYIDKAIWSPDGQSIATSSLHGVVRIWNATTGDVITQFTANSYAIINDRMQSNSGPSWIRDIAYSADGRYILTISEDGTVQSWDTILGTIQSQAMLPAVGTARFSPFAGQLTYMRLGLLTSDVASASANQGSLLEVTVPFATQEMLDALLRGCEVPVNQQTRTDLSTLTAQVAALPDTQIPPGCRADLLAVAAALQAQ
jgi:WD40 repeat protein